MIRRRLAAAVAGAVVAVLPVLGAPALAAPGPPEAPEYWFDDWDVPQLWASGARVISMSLGGIRRQSEDPQACPTGVQQAVYYALRKGAVLLAASGNRGISDNAVEEPGVCPGVITVGAVNAAGQVAAFSSRHPYLTLTAPGVEIASLSRVPGSAYRGKGTSQATAITAAVVALVWSKYPKLSARAVVTRLLATLRHGAVSSNGAHSSAYGYGTLDAHGAVLARVPKTAPNPVYEAVEPFLHRQAALAAQQVTPPAPATTAPPAAGTFVRGSAPAATHGEAVLGLALGSAGLLALLVLALIGARGRRRARITTDVAAVAAPVQDGGLVWHEIGDPTRAPDDPTR
jgi:subtilisin family serine protease